MDFEKLRAKTIASAQEEEAVTVNTRALIDKVLARYSGEWTTLRELIQNAADAQASTVTIKFETIPSASVPLPSNSTNQSEILKHTLLNHTLSRLVVTNDGLPFGQNDWTRLKRIAEGNPDETKIGAFGVGFYSVFADCEDPFVSSGNEAMAFYWKGNSLFTRRLQLDAGDASNSTSFVLNYRNTTSPVPSLLSLCQFLATSLTFVALQNIELWLDGWKILDLKKKASPGVEVPIPRDVETKTKDGLMKIQSLERESVQMDATFMNVVGWKPAVPSKPVGSDSYGSNPSDVPSLKSFFSRLTSRSDKNEAKNKKVAEEKATQDQIDDKLTVTTTANVFLRITTAMVKTFCSASFSAELERATKKPPPKMTKLSILTSSYDELAASNGSSKADLVAKTVDIWSSVLPTKKPGGRIFIGFPTHQTTGAGMHLSAPSLIPTVERESADLQARWVRNWNIEMLRASGITTRLAFAGEMADLGDKVRRAAEAAGRGTKINLEDVSKFLPEAEHILRTYTFGESTPSAQVAQLIEEAFWMTYKKACIEIYSTRGVLLTTTVRLTSDDLNGFVDGIPVVPKELAQERLIQKLQDFGLITEITTGDIKQELERKSLNKDQLIKFLEWASRKALAGDIAIGTLQSLFDVTVATIGEKGPQGSVIALSTIECFLDPKKIPPEVPIPPNTLDFEITRNLNTNHMEALGFRPLELVPWLRYVDTLRGGAAEHDITMSPKFAAQVLAIFSKSWESLSASSKATVISLLQSWTCVPTKSGMKKPQEAYFPSVKLFDDLPVVTGCPSVKDKFFAALGVRKTVELNVIFERLLSPPAYEEKDMQVKKWSHVDLIKYLTSVKDDIPGADMARLRDAYICPAEKGPRTSGGGAGSNGLGLYKISELYVPEEELRQLGLPTLSWPGQVWRLSSPEARFLSQLGLQMFPSVPVLVGMMSSTDQALRNKAMGYFVTRHAINKYDRFSLADAGNAFLPVEGDEKLLVKPADCFTNDKAAVLGFHILKKGLHPHAAMFGVGRDPSMAECCKRLANEPPLTRRDAIPIFNYLSTRHLELSSNDAMNLGDIRIVPITPRASVEESPEKISLHVQFVTPKQCYIGDSETYREIFTYIDFGQASNTFLLKCGAKHEPSKTEIAARVCREPARLLNVLQTPEKYLKLLQSLAEDMATLKKDKNLWKQMKSSKFLLAMQEIKSSAAPRPRPATDGPIDDEDDDEGAPVRQYSLAYPSDIVILDDYTSYRLFREALLICPESDVLEQFYVALGAPCLSDIVEEYQRIGRTTDRQASAQKLQKLILERAKIFLYEHARDYIKHDAKWLEKYLTVKTVDGITLRKSLKGYPHSHNEKRTVALTNESRDSWILWVTNDFDLFEVSMQVSKLLLERPKRQAYLAFETLLASDLYKLRARGYNVDRILKHKEAEARLAEDRRRKMLEEEQAKMREDEELWRQQSQIATGGSASTAVTASARAAIPPSPDRPMPGAFDVDDPDTPPRESGRNSLFSNFTRHFNSNNNEGHGALSNIIRGIRGNSQQHIDSPQDSADAPPPPYNEAGGPRSINTSGPQTATSPAALSNNLQRAIKASRAHNSSGVFSAPSTTNVKETSTYCDSTPAHNITFAGPIAHGIRMYVANSMASAGTAQAFLQSHTYGLNTFARMLKDVAEVYDMELGAMHVFYDEQSQAIAFNSSGSVFCNYSYFEQLHLKTLDGAGGTGAEKRIEAIAYWWSTVAHELAHNVVGAHGQEHSYYTEAFVTMYFAKMAAKSMEFAAAPLPAGNTQTVRSLLD